MTPPVRGVTCGRASGGASESTGLGSGSGGVANSPGVSGGTVIGRGIPVVDGRVGSVVKTCRICATAAFGITVSAAGIPARLSATGIVGVGLGISGESTPFGGAIPRTVISSGGTSGGTGIGPEDLGLVGCVYSGYPYCLAGLGDSGAGRRGSHGICPVAPPGGAPIVFGLKVLCGDPGISICVSSGVSGFAPNRLISGASPRGGRRRGTASRRRSSPSRIVL